MELTTEAQAIRAFLLSCSGPVPMCDVAAELDWNDDDMRVVLEDLEQLQLVEQVPFVGWTWVGA